jgi:hypothetical protein
MTELIAGYTIYELKRYIEIAEQSESLRAQYPDEYCANKEKQQ